MKHGWPILLGMALGLAPMPSGSAVADDVRAADAAFAARAAEVGHQTAFLEFLAEDAVLFRPEAVNGPQWLGTHEPAGGQLEWTPTAAAVDCTGRLGITSGRWAYANADGGEPVAGHYLTVWRLNAESRWQVILDHGIDHDARGVPAVDLGAAFASLWAASEPPRCKGRGDADDLAAAEQALNARINVEGLASARRGFMAASAIAYRDDVPPARLSDLPASVEAAFGPGSIARPVGTIFEPGTNLAVTHGVLEAADGQGRALYVRVWNRDRRRWQVAIDLRTPLPTP